MENAVLCEEIAQTFVLRVKLYKGLGILLIF
jgi:hypothetical protein